MKQILLILIFFSCSCLAADINIQNTFSDEKCRELILFFDAMHSLDYISDSTKKFNIVEYRGMFGDTINAHIVAGLNRRAMTIFIKPNLDTNTFMRCIAHEFVHYRQWVRCDFTYIGDTIEIMCWHGTSVRVLAHSTCYREREWEVEAYRRQSQFYRLYKNYKREKKRQ